MPAPVPFLALAKGRKKGTSIIKRKKRLSPVFLKLLRCSSINLIIYHLAPQIILTL